MTTSRIVLRVAPTSLLAVALACSDYPTTSRPDATTHVAITQLDGTQPALFVGRVDGSGRTRIHFTTVADSIPGNRAELAVNDNSLIALGSPSIAPLGLRIAVVATLAFDQSEIVVMRTDGTGEVASINTQIIAGDPEWSPDGTKLAYVMSTLPNFRGLDLFVTDLTTHTVTRLTTNANVGNAAIAWSADGSAIYYSHTTGTATGEPSNWLSEVVRVNAATGASQTIASNVVGQITSVARSGSRVLLTRNVTLAAGITATRALIEATLGTVPSERVLLGSDAAYAHYFTDTDSYAVMVTATNVSVDVTDHFLVASLDANKVTSVANVASGAGKANVDAAMILPLR
jgi:dipeptidyl aminopeptidase/acylaminoacyl peptidase